MTSPLRLLQESLFENSVEGVLFGTTTGVVMRANPAACRMLGYSEAELIRIGRSGFVVDNSKLVNLLATRREQGSITAPLDFRRADGTTFPVEVTSVLVSGPSGEGLACTTFRDITERTKIEQALRDTKTRLSLVIDSTDDGYSDWDVLGGQVKYSRRFATMLGYDLSDLEPAVSTWERLVHPDDRQPAWDAAQAHLGGQTERFESEERLRHKDGRWIWTLHRGKVVERDATGNPLRMVGTHADISARKLVEEKLIASEARFRALAEGAPIGIFETDADGRNVYLNPMGAEIIGRSQDAARGQGWADSIHPGDRDRVLREWSEAIAGGKVFTSEYRFQRPDGQSILARGYAVAVRDAACGITGYVGVVMDITRMRSIERQLALSSRLATLGTLVAGVAHEINNPLAAELASQGLVLEVAQEARRRYRDRIPIDPEAQVHLLDEVIAAMEDAQEGGKRIARIVRDLAVFATPDLRRTRVRLEQVVADAIRLLHASIARDASIKVEQAAAPEVMASSSQMEQVVVNLVNNAARAVRPGQHGEIVIRTGPGARGTTYLEVTDDGVGIAPANQSRIFDPFFTTRPAGEGHGSGLGLAICQAIVTAHDGTITVDSVVGKGSTFRVELPAAPSEA
jgi:PAS domain S-box-containing protein